jgi:dihydrodipicolinate synthase/N-acetylneuraminate lyase
MGKKEEAPLASGVYAALATPRPQNSVEGDAAALFDYLDLVQNRGVDGIVLFGSTGEFVHFDITERIRLLMLAKKRCRVPLLVNVSHSTLAGAIELAEDAIEAGVAGLLLMPPYYFHYTSCQIAEFYRQFIKEVDGKISVYLYNIPQFTNPIPPEAMEELLAGGAFAGIKDSSGDWALFEKLLAVKSAHPFQLLIGNDAIYRRARPLGADGIVSGVAAAVPELLAALERALAANQTERADELEARLHEFLLWLDRFPAPIGIKIAASARGWKLANTAVPYDEQTVAAKREFEHWFKEWLPLALQDKVL